MSQIVEFLPQAWPILLGYLVGATPFGFLAGKMKGIDIRDHGSGNIGATNVLRTLGKPIGITVLVLDILKGMVPVIVAMRVADGSSIAIATAIAAILGHNYTFWLGFKGGKGIATTGGAIAPLMPWSLLTALVLWLIVLKLTRYVSVASLVAAASVPVSLAVQYAIAGEWDWPVFGFGLFVWVLATWKHRSNIDRLLKGTENRFGPKPEPESAPNEPSQSPNPPSP